LVDDGGADQRAERPGVGDRKGAVCDVVQREFLATGACRDIGDVLGDRESSSITSA